MKVLPGRYRPIFSNNVLAVREDGAGVLIYLDGEMKEKSAEQVTYLFEQNMIVPLAFCNLRDHRRDHDWLPCEGQRRGHAQHKEPGFMGEFSAYMRNSASVMDPCRAS